jgi:hypothetical protein
VRCCGHLDDVHGYAEAVRKSVELVRAERTAALRFLPSLIDSEPPLDERLAEVAPLVGRGLRVLGAIRRQVMTRLQISEIPGPLGRTDFINERSLYDGGGQGWTLTAPGLEFVGEPGEWERVVLEDETLVGYVDPMWLLELIAAAVEAIPEGAELVVAEPCTRFATLASLSRARDRSARPMESPSSRGRLDVERVPVDVWLDADGRIRRGVMRADRTLMILELSDFGGPQPIDLPKPGEVLPDER